MQILDITLELNNYKDQIVSFLDRLDSEKRYFNPFIERVMSCQLILAAINFNEIVGIAGIEKKYGIARSIIMVRDDFQKKALGLPLFLGLLAEAKRKHSLIMGLVDVENVTSLKLGMVTGYKTAGRRGKLYYTINPFNRKGKFLFYLIRTLFPLFKVLDLIRR